jgi:hypothetical protein
VGYRKSGGTTPCTAKLPDDSPPQRSLRLRAVFWERDHGGAVNAGSLPVNAGSPFCERCEGALCAPARYGSERSRQAASVHKRTYTSSPKMVESCAFGPVNAMNAVLHLLFIYGFLLCSVGHLPTGRHPHSPPQRSLNVTELLSQLPQLCQSGARLPDQLS